MTRPVIQRSSLALVIAALPLAGCAGDDGFSRTQKGAAAGAVLGGIAGGVFSNTVRGTIIGAVVGGVAGGVIGHVMDRRAADLTTSLDNATVERVGEGIAVAFEPDALFEEGSADIRTAAEADLRELARTLNDEPETRALIVGHADAESGGMALAERRARAVRDFLVAQGVERGRLQTQAQVESDVETSLEVAIYASEDMQKAALQQAMR